MLRADSSAGVPTPVARGGAAGVRASLERAQGTPVKGSLAKAAGRLLRRQVDLEDANPVPDTPAARAEHAQRMTDSQVARSEGHLRPHTGAISGRESPEARSGWRVA